VLFGCVILTAPNVSPLLVKLAGFHVPARTYVIFLRSAALPAADLQLDVPLLLMEFVN
jgi:hypothetical protein